MIIANDLYWRMLYNERERNPGEIIKKAVQRLIILTIWYEIFSVNSGIFFIKKTYHCSQLIERTFSLLYLEQFPNYVITGDMRTLEIDLLNVLELYISFKWSKPNFLSTLSKIRYIILRLYSMKYPIFLTFKCLFFTFERRSNLKTSKNFWLDTISILFHY